MTKIDAGDRQVTALSIKEAKRLVSDAVLYGILRASLMLALIGILIRVVFFTVFG